MVLLLAIIIASALRPVVRWLTERGIPESVSIVTVYATLGLFIIGLAVALLPPIVNQLSVILEDDNRLSSGVIRAQNRVEDVLGNIMGEEVTLMKFTDVHSHVERIVAQLRAILPGMADDGAATLGEIVLIFVMGAYWLTSHEKAIAFVTQLSPLQHRDKITDIINEIETTMGGYVRGVVIVASLVGLLNFGVFTIFGVPGAAALAVVIAIITTIPMIGGFLGGVLATFMTLLTAPDYVPIVIITFLIIQQIENYILSPRIISTQVHLDSLLVIVYTAIGFVMYGIVGALIAVPLMGTVHILVTHLVIEPHKKNIQAFQTHHGLPVMKIIVDDDGNEREFDVRDHDHDRPDLDAYAGS